MPEFKPSATVLPMTSPVIAPATFVRPNVLEVEHVWKVFGSTADHFKGLDLEQKKV